MMKLWICGLVIGGYISSLMSQSPGAESHETSPTGYVLIGLALLAVVIIILIRRQKRKFND